MGLVTTPKLLRDAVKAATREVYRDQKRSADPSPGVARALDEGVDALGDRIGKATVRLLTPKKPRR